MQLFGLRKTPDLSHAPRQALAALEHFGLRSSDGRFCENRPFAHSGRFCRHKSTKYAVNHCAGKASCHRLYLWSSRSRAHFLRGGPGCSGHPAFPAPSDFQGGTTTMQNSGERRRENMFACALTAPAGLIAPLALERELRDVGCSHGLRGAQRGVRAPLYRSAWSRR